VEGEGYCGDGGWWEVGEGGEGRGMREWRRGSVEGGGEVGKS
jgi:hypothetical protein